MIRIILIMLVFTTFGYTGIMDSIGDVVKSTLGDDEGTNIPKVETVGTISVANGGRKKKKDDSLFSGLEGMVDDVKDSVEDVTDSVGTVLGEEKKKRPKPKKSSMFDDMLGEVKSTIGIKEEKKKKKSSFLKDTETSEKEAAGLKKVKQDNSLFDGGIMGEMADMIDLEKGETWGLPSVFGLNKKSQNKVFGSTVLGDTLLGDVKDASTGFYRGFKNTGESAEFMSGVMYKSSKVYNGMFGMFDDSMFNVFDDKDEREPSVFDMLGTGNSMLDMFD